MVQANIDNQPISILLANNEQTTVPNGEVWDVDVQAKRGGNSNYVFLNGERITEPDTAGKSFSAVLVGGDTVSTDSAHALISGYVVS